jgi:hypothetical protein
MLEANPQLDPLRVRELLTLACRRVEGAPAERQGAGAIDAGSAVALAITDADDVAYPAVASACPGQQLRFVLNDPDAIDVRVAGSWDRWAAAATRAVRVAPSLLQVTLPPLSSGSYAYKFVVDDRWIADPANRRQAIDGLGGTNSTFDVR